MARLFSGELKHAINDALGAGSAAPVEQRIHKLLKDNPVMLFMKGGLLLPASNHATSVQLLAELTCVSACLMTRSCFSYHLHCTSKACLLKEGAFAVLAQHLSFCMCL